jgi:hypothetical protein
VAPAPTLNSSEEPAIHPESLPSAEITSYKPTSRYLSASPDLDYFRFADFHDKS